MIADKFKSCLMEYGIDYSDVNFSDQTVAAIVDVIKHKLICSSLDFNISKEIYCKILQIYRHHDINQMIKEILKYDLDILVSKYNFKIVKDQLILDKLILCESVSDPCTYKILTDPKIQKIKDLGYFITRVIVDIDAVINCVRCEGNHPNVNSVSKLYCLPYELVNSKFCVSNIVLLLFSLTHINLYQSYLSSDQRSLIKEVIND